MKHISPINLISKEELQLLLDNSNSVCDVLKHFNLNPLTGNHRTLHIRILRDGLNLDKLKQNRLLVNKIHISKLTNRNKIPNDKIFIETSLASRHEIKKRLITDNLIKYVCRDCGCTGEWNKKKLILQLEHINGVNNDCRIHNLCFLCPNCHSQTDTFAGRNAKKYKVKKECKPRPQKFIVKKDELFKLVYEKPITHIGKQFKVSDNAIRKRCKILGVDIPKFKRGHWLKLE